jgi:mannose-6-phosphate isomerase-like protein (cupin superfamily)
MKSALAATAISAFALSIGVSSSTAQAPAVDHLTRAQLTEMAQKLATEAQVSGSASTKIADYPNHYTMISLREKSGGAEIHENFADFFIVVQGHATLVSGGKVVDAKTVSAGETRGASVQDGTQQSLNPGDVVHIPAGVPHQMLLANGDAITYFVIKVREK